MDELVYRSNVIFEFQKSVLSGEVTKDEFMKAKEIINRAKRVENAAVEFTIGCEDMESFMKHVEDRY